MKSAFGSHALIRSALIVTGATYVTYVTGLVISMLAARGLGPADYGRYSYVVWLSGMLVVACTNGLTTTGIKFVAECLGRDDGEAAARVYGMLRRYFMLSTVVACLAFLVLARFTLPDGWEGGIGLFAAVVLASGVAKAFYLLHSSVAKGHGNFGIEANTTNLLGLVGLVATIGLVVSRRPLESYLELLVVLSVCHALLTFFFIRRTTIRPAQGPIEASMARRLRIHLAWTVLLVLLATFSNRTVETFLLNRTVGAEAVGFFIIAATITRGGADLLVNGLTAVLIPAMAHSYGRGGAAGLNPILSNSIRYFLFMGLVLAGVGVLCAELAIRLLYGPEYAPVVNVFRVMVVVAGLTLMEGAFNALLTTTDHQRLRVVLTMAAVTVSAILAFALVPRYGLTGAVAAHLIAKMVMFTTIVITATRTMQVRLPWREIGRQFACTAVAAALAALVWWAGDGAWIGLVAGVVYAVAMVVCSFLFKSWSAEDLEMLAQLTTRFPRACWLLAALARLGVR